MARQWTEEQKQAQRNRMKLLNEKKAEQKVVLASDDDVEEYVPRKIRSAKESKDTNQIAEAFKDVVRELRTIDKGRDENLVEALAESHRRLVKPENQNPPLVSAFNPLGDRDHPRPQLQCKTVRQCGFPIQPKACTYEELETINTLINKIHEARKHGQSLPNYMVSKADGSQANVKLECRFNDVTGLLEELDINYPVKTIDMRTGQYSFLHMLKEMLGEARPDIDVYAVMMRNKALEAENQQLRQSMK